MRRRLWGGEEEEGEGQGEGRSLMGRDEGEGDLEEGDLGEGDLGEGEGEGERDWVGGGRRGGVGLILIFWWPRLRIVACRSTW